MKRPLIPAAVIGALVTTIVSAVHARGWLSTPEMWFVSWITHVGSAETGAGKWQYLFIALFSFASAWIMIVSTRRLRVVWLLVAVMAEILALTWICSLYGIVFQPLPSLLAIILSSAAALGFLDMLARRKRSVVSLAGFEGKLITEQIARLRSGEINFDGNAAAFETSVLVCDLANKYDLAETDEPAAVAAASEQFTRRATEFLLKTGAYLHAADGEGVVAVFGFPGALKDHAEKAVRASFDLARHFGAGSSNGENAPGAGVHVGVSSGSIIAAPSGADGAIFVLGEPVELARRFCVANRFYGSRILVGPLTFELANESVIARPIDFLSGVNSQERHEVYEPLALSADAPSELVARRDSFWNGVVFFREKRWAEAYAAFQKARDPEGEEDAPLNLYLRRLEPLALHLMESPGE